MKFNIYKLNFTKQRGTCFLFGWFLLKKAAFSFNSLFNIQKLNFEGSLIVHLAGYYSRSTSQVKCLIQRIEVWYQECFRSSGTDNPWRESCSPDLGPLPFPSAVAPPVDWPVCLSSPPPSWSPPGGSAPPPAHSHSFHSLEMKSNTKREGLLSVDDGDPGSIHTCSDSIFFKSGGVWNSVRNVHLKPYYIYFIHILSKSVKQLYYIQRNL